MGEVHLDIALSPDRWRDQLGQQALRSGGGTDFEPALARAAQHAPSLAVILTDLDGPTGPAPRFPMIWATPGEAPPFGRVLRLDQA